MRHQSVAREQRLVLILVRNHEVLVGLGLRGVFLGLRDVVRKLAVLIVRLALSYAEERKYQREQNQAAGDDADRDRRLARKIGDELQGGDGSQELHGAFFVI